MHRIQNTHICSTSTIQIHNMQHIQDNTEQNTENNTEHKIQNTEYNTEQRTENSTYDLHTYSFDLYHEYAYIKNSNTIELYTISK